MEIGEPVRIWEVEPIDDPVPQRREDEPEPVWAPTREEPNK